MRKHKPADDAATAMPEEDARFLQMFSNCRFGGSVTMPSGRVYSGEEMTALSATVERRPRDRRSGVAS